MVYFKIIDFHNEHCVVVFITLVYVVRPNLFFRHESIYQCDDINKTKISVSNKVSKLTDLQTIQMK